MSDNNPFYSPEIVKLLSIYNYEVYRKIEHIIESEDITQKKFAEIISINPSLISKWKSGEREVTFGMLEVISEKFHIPMAYFCDDEVGYYIAPVSLSYIDKVNNIIEVKTQQKDSLSVPIQMNTAVNNSFTNKELNILITESGDNILIQRIANIKNFYNEFDDIEEELVVLDGNNKLYTDCTFEVEADDLFYFNTNEGDIIPIMVKDIFHRVAINRGKPLILPKLQ